MRLYPPFNKQKVKIEKPLEFYKYLKSVTATNGSVRNASLKGVINEEGFKVEKIFFHYNGGRSMIRGKFEKGTEDYLTIYLECKNGPIIFIALFLIYILITGVIKESIYTLFIMLSVSVFFYFLFWLLFLVDLKKTKIEMDKIIEKATNPN